jgi:hypothetical protein
VKRGGRIVTKEKQDEETNTNDMTTRRERTTHPAVTASARRAVAGAGTTAVTCAWIHGLGRLGLLVGSGWSWVWILASDGFDGR